MVLLTHPFSLHRLAGNRSKNKPATMELDHVLPLETGSDLFTILYADVYDSQFAAFRRYLDSLSNSHGLQYSIRYRPSTASEKAPNLVLAGYGVELALKSTDYIVIDDRDLGHGDDQGASKQTVFGQGSGKDLFGDEVPAVEPVSQQDLGGIALFHSNVFRSHLPAIELFMMIHDLKVFTLKYYNTYLVIF